MWVCAINSKVVLSVHSRSVALFLFWQCITKPLFHLHFTVGPTLCRWFFPGLILINLLAAFDTAHHPLGILPEPLDTTISSLPPTSFMAPTFGLSSLKGECLHPLLIYTHFLGDPTQASVFNILSRPLLLLTATKTQVIMATLDCFLCARYELQVLFHLIL